MGLGRELASSYRQPQLTSNSGINFVTVLMNELDLDIQGAADHVGEVCVGLLSQYERGRKNLPSWDAETDIAVARYVKALGCWIRSLVEYEP